MENCCTTVKTGTTQLLFAFVYPSIADFGTPVVIGGRFETVSTEIYMQVIGYSRLDKSAALNVLLLIPTILVFILYRYLMQKNEKVISGNSNKTVEAGDTFRFVGCQQ